jgi:ribonuclease HI
MMVTVMSDASFCPQTKSAGWGVWIKSQRGFFEGGGNFKTAADTSSDAEAMAISIAAFLAFRQGIAVEGDTVLVQTDCMMVVNLMNDIWDGKRKFKRKLTGYSKAIKYTLDLVRKNKCKLVVRHVKGHAPGLAGRNYVNEICDKHAKFAMKKQRAEKAERTVN